MKKVLIAGLLFLCGCAGLPTNIVDNSIPPTIVELTVPKDQATAAVLKLAAKQGWKIEQGRPGDNMIVADDPAIMPGWLMNYNVRYIFTVTPTEKGSSVNIEGVAVMHGDNGPFVKDGRTSALKLNENKAAAALAQSK